MSSDVPATPLVVTNSATEPTKEKDNLKFPRALYEAVRLWTNDELDTLIFALETDSLLTPSELMKFIPTKDATEIDSLLQLILRSREEDILPALVKQQPPLSEGESSIDIFRNSVRFAVADQFSPTKQIASALRELADKEGGLCLTTATVSGSRNKTSAQHQARPDFSQIYNFLASLFTPGKPLELEPCNAAVIFDTLLCILTVVGRIMNQLPMDSQLSNIVRGLTEKVGNLLGMLAVARNCMHVLRGWGDAKSKAALPAYRRSVKSSRPSILPCPAVICVLQEADLPEGYDLNRQLCTLLRNLMERLWQFPTSDGDTATELLRHSLENYILNPLGIPPNEVPAISLAVCWQKLMMLHYQQSILPMLSLPPRYRPSGILPKTNEPKDTPPAKEALPSKANSCLIKRRQYSRTSDSYRRLDMQVTQEDIDAHITTTFILRDSASTLLPRKRPRKDNIQH